MGRTPLLRNLKRLATDHIQADRLGLPVEELRYRRARAAERGERAGGISRRQFLTGAAALGATATMAVGASRALADDDQPRIAIIGAGMAGLTAAHKLRRKGYDSTIYEADIRVGGRVLSERGEGSPWGAQKACAVCHGFGGSDQFTWEAGMHSDVIAELIDTHHKTLIRLANRFDLNMIDILTPEPGEHTYWFNEGGYYYAEDADADWQLIRPKLRKELRRAPEPWEYNPDTMTDRFRKLDEMSLKRWLKKKVEPEAPQMAKLLDAAYTAEFGADTKDQSALNLIYLLGYSDREHLEIYGESDEGLTIEGGVDRLTNAMADYLLGEDPGSIRFDHQLEAIEEKHNGSYRLHFANRWPKHADYVILAIPFAVLRDLDYANAGFDEVKIRAINELGIGIGSKLCLQFDQRFWQLPGRQHEVSTGTSYSDTGYQVTWDGSAGQNYDPNLCSEDNLGCLTRPEGILINYIGGSATHDMELNHVYGNTGAPGTNPHATLVGRDALRFIEQLKPVFGDDVGSFWNGRAVENITHLSPFYKTSYCFFERGNYQSFAGYEYQRQGNILFAGTHTHLEFQGWLEGAALTGKMAAKDIISEIGGDPDGDD